jgi:hypothetical protein
MAKNRKNQSAAIRFGPVLKVLALCVLMAGSGLGYVWQKKTIQVLGEKRIEKEFYLEELEDQIQNLEQQYADLSSHRNLEAQVRRLGLELVKPAPNQIMVLREFRMPVPRERERGGESGDLMHYADAPLRSEGTSR